MDDHFNIGRAFEIGKFDITRLTCMKVNEMFAQKGKEQSKLQINSTIINTQSLALCICHKPFEP